LYKELKRVDVEYIEELSDEKLALYINELNFKKTAKDYKLIDETENLIIPYNDDACKIIEALKYSEYQIALARKLQPYTISVHQI
jgi:hypothetical protein